MTKILTIKANPPRGPPLADFVVVACPKCGKITYGVLGQKAKKCPVCRRTFPMPSGASSPHFVSPEAACRFIQGEEAKKAGRLDFAPASPAFSPAASNPVVDRTPKVVTDRRTLNAQFATWAQSYFLAAKGSFFASAPTVAVIAAAAQAEFTGAEKLIEQAVASGLLCHPKPYSLGLATGAFNPI